MVRIFRIKVVYLEARVLKIHDTGRATDADQASLIICEGSELGQIKYSLFDIERALRLFFIHAIDLLSFKDVWVLAPSKLEKAFQNGVSANFDSYLATARGTGPTIDAIAKITLASFDPTVPVPGHKATVFDSKFTAHRPSDSILCDRTGERLCNRLNHGRS